MSTRLIISPPATGKTSKVIRHLRATLHEEPLAQVWVVVTGRLQAAAFQRQVAISGGALGSHIGTFGDIYTEILESAGKPFPAALEITEALLPITIVFALAYHELHSGHVRITLLSSRFSLRQQAISDIVAQTSAFIIFIIFGWLSFDYALVAWTLKETTWGLVAIPLWIPKLAITVGCFHFALSSLSICLSKIIYIRAVK